MDVKDDIIALFSQFPNIIFHKGLIDDIVNFCNKKNDTVKRELFVSLHESLEYLNRIGYKAALASGNRFKKMRETDGLYRFTLPVNDFNLRVIYAEKGKCELLLLFFDEKAGKSKTDYQWANKTAFKRLQQLG